MKPFRCERILATTDLSPFAAQAVDYAHSLAETFGAELHVLHVVRDATQMAVEHGVTGVLEAGEGDEYDRWLAGLLGEQGTVRRVEAVRLGDDIAATVAEYARKNDIDLIVTATHGRSGLRHLLMGSVAEHILRKAPCPVLVIRPTGEDKGAK